MKILQQRLRLLAFSLATFCLFSAPAGAEPPKRLMVLVFDQNRAEYVDRFDLPNFKRARELGVHFPNAQVGHLESNTIISHPVITTGRFPKNIGWGAEAWRDAEGLIGPKGQYFTPFYLRPQEWLGVLQRTAGDSSLVAAVKSRNKGPAFAVAQKKYAAFTFGGPYVDSIICLGKVYKDGPFKDHHTVGGLNVPDYIRLPEGNRFYLEGVERWGSEVERYSLKGSGYVTGKEPERPGGDAWVGDVVEKIMSQDPDWSVLLASFGATDKVSHVLAEHDGPTTAPWAIEHGIGLEDTLRKADLELGRILDRLEKEEILEETVIVLTADHGGQRSSHFLGRMRPGKHRHDSYYGKAINFDFTSDPHPALQPFIASGKLQAASMDTLALFWTSAMTPEERTKFEDNFRDLPGLSEGYRKVKTESGYRYQRFFRSPKLQGRALAWAKAHHQDLTESLACASGPEFLGTLFDNTGYGLLGSHGGAQELVQRIPMILIAPNLNKPGATEQQRVRLVDVNPMVRKALALPHHSGLDGTAAPLLPHLEN